jgi:UDP:flavonoid glycosyltransferase YjiC (YdhE family)
VPAVIVPFFADQFFWGWRVEQLGVGPPVIRRGQLTAENLAVAVREAVNNQEMITNAARLSEKLRAEDGVNNAVQAIESIMQDPPYVHTL